MLTKMGFKPRTRQIMIDRASNIQIDLEKEEPKVAELPAQFENSSNMKLRLIPRGKFRMGSPNTEGERGDDEGPVRDVEISKPFYIGVYEVTQEQYQAVMGKNPSRFDAQGGGGPNHPVDGVSYDDAVEFCQRLSVKEGKLYRLPTEAEWECACRANTTSVFNNGNSLGDKDAHVDVSMPFGNGKKGTAPEKTAPVGQFPANDWGLHDMHGNLWEWCNDWYGEKTYGDKNATDPLGPTEGGSRVLRGGSFQNAASEARSARRYKFEPNTRSTVFGFRVEMNPASDGKK